MTAYRDRRVEVLRHVEAIAAILRPLAPEDRDTEHALVVDDLYDALDVRAEYDPTELAAAFTDACRDFWQRENELHSVKAPPALTLIKGQGGI